MSKFKKISKCPVKVSEKWGNGYLVVYPVSYRYNGGIVIDDTWYEGFEVVKPVIPEGLKLQGIGIGLQLNARPPYATSLITKADGTKISKKELQSMLV